MPEYSSTTITPADGVQTPAMNGSTSGNYTLSDLRDFILASKGQASGLASLDANGKLPTSQLPDLADDVLVYDSYALLPSPGTADKLYITADDNKMYRWDPDLATPDYVVLSVDLSAYATKAEVEAADSDLKSAFNGLDNRVSNLEQKAGDYGTWHYPNDPNHTADMPNLVPTGKAKYGLVESIVGKTRAWNQLASLSSSDWTLNNVAFSSSGNIITITPTTDSSTTKNVYIPIVQGHKYLVCGSVEKNADGGASVALGFFGSAHGARHVVASNDSATKVSFCEVYLTASEDYYFEVRPSSSMQTSEYAICDELILRDLTLIFPEGIPATVADCVAKCPDILKYDAYGYSLVDTTVSGVKSYSPNVVDQSVVLNVAGTSESDGFITMNSVADVSTYLQTNLSWSDFKENTQYTFSWIGKNGTATYVRLYVVYTDGTSDDIATIDSTSATAMSGVSDAGKTIEYVRLARSSNGSFSFKELMVNEGTTAQPYIKYGVVDTLPLPSSVTLRSAGDGTNEAHDTLELESGEITRNALQESITTIDEIYTRGGNTNVKFAVFTTTKPFLGGSIVHKFTWKNGGISAYSFDSCAVTNEMLVYSSGSHQLAVSVPYSYSKSDAEALLSGTLYNYAPSEVTTESVTPVIDNTIETEGSGTINTIQTQSPVIDNSLDVGYLAL